MAKIGGKKCERCGYRENPITPQKRVMIFREGGKDIRLCVRCLTEFGKMDRDQREEFYEQVRENRRKEGRT